MTTKNIKKDENNFMNKDTISLDTPERPEYDNMESSSLLSSDSDSSTLSPSGERSISPFLSFPCLTRESRSYECRIESGRSMVEMLGTLAIIGVLSIGGIMGYSYGMDKYRANETINDIMLMGVDIMTQLSQNRGIPTLSEWGTKTTVGYDFEVVQNPEDVTQYGIQIIGVPSSICKIVGDGLKQTVAVYVGNEDYNSDAETDPCDESDKNTMEFYFDAMPVNVECKNDMDCGDGNYCDFGLCFSGAKPEGTARIIDTICETDADCNQRWEGVCARCEANRCIEKFDLNHTSCTLKNGVAGKCMAAECFPSGCTYDENNCGEMEYCASSNDLYHYTNCDAFREGVSGMCVSANARFNSVKIDKQIYYYSNSMVTWWDADAGCRALGRDGLLNVNDLIYDWNGETTDESHEFTILGQALREHLGTNNYVWTENKADTCSAYLVNLNNGSVGFRMTNYFAVCK